MQASIENLTTALGLRLREERERLSLSQADAGLLGSVTREMWGRYERGAMPSAEVLLRVQGHGFDVNYILGGSRTLSESTLTDDEAELVNDYRATDDEGRVSISRMARMERMRTAEPMHAYSIRTPTSSAVVAHDAPAKKKPRR